MLIAILGGLAGGALVWWLRRRRRAARDFTPETVQRLERIERERDIMRSTMRDV